MFRLILTEEKKIKYCFSKYYKFFLKLYTVHFAVQMLAAPPQNITLNIAVGLLRDFLQQENFIILFLPHLS